MIGGGDNPQYYSERVLQNKGEPEALIKLVDSRKPLAPETFERLAKYSDRYVNHMLGSNPACPLNLLRDFSENSDRYVRRGVAYNPNAPYDILKKLAGDENWRVRYSLGRNPAIPEDIMKSFANSDDWYAHTGLAENPSVPPDMLRQIYQRYKNDEKYKKFIRSCLAMNPKLPEDIARDIYLQEKDKTFSLALDFLTTNPAVPAPLLLEIYHNNKSDISLSRYAQNPNCPAEIKQAIQNSDDWQAKEALKRNQPI
jgi:uncharacterized protein YneF (UPF0154 family)